MDEKQSMNTPAEYKIGNIKYTTIPIFGEAPHKESVEDKIKRLILQDKKQKGAKL